MKELTYDELVFGICWYNDPSILRLLDSLPSEAEKIIIDGKFKFNPNPQELSDHSLREAVLNYPNVRLIDAPNLLEPDKRQIYLTDNLKKYLMIIDSDEYVLVADWNKFYDFITTLDSGIHHIFFEVDANGGSTTYPRLWVNPSDWKYVKTHNIFKNEKLGLILKSGFSDGETCPGLLCSMGDDLRSSEYLKDVYDYQVEMIKYELPFRHAYRDGDMSPFV